MYRNADFRKYQIFSYAQWPGGLFGSPSMAGTRPGENDVTQCMKSHFRDACNLCIYSSLFLGGNIAASWVTLKHLGQDGYMKIARQLMDTTEKLITGIKDIPVRFHLCWQTFDFCSFYYLLCLVRGVLMFEGFVYSRKAAYDVIRNCVR